MTAKRTIPSAEYFKEFLLRIYRCKVPFELLVIDKRPKTRMGVYILGKRRIRIYSKWIDHTPLEEIAIHEYAHHIHNTEKGGIFGRGARRAHGEYFWRIYSALMAKAMLNGLYEDSLTEDIILQ
jgi:hypothetical protein